jgi:hypothetical protein
MTLSVLPSDPVLVDLIGALNSVGSGAGFRNTERALSAISGSVAKSWQMAVGSDHRIERKKLTPFSHSVFSRDDVVHWLEYGLAPFDMKMTHTKGQKSRIVKPRKGPDGKLIMSWSQKRKDGTTYTVHAGDPYLIIPFRHRTKGKGKGDQKSLEDVYPEVKRQMQGEDFQRSKVTKSPEKSGKVSPNYWRHAVQRAEYSWGSRFDFPETDEYKNLQGLVAMGSPKQSQFMSFRVVSVNSPAASWLHPGIKARHNLENILKRGQEQIRTVIEEALAKDLM